jgi:hypothetical protein
MRIPHGITNIADTQHDEIDFRPRPRKLLEVEYPAWRKRVAAKTDQ